MIDYSATLLLIIEILQNPRAQGKQKKYNPEPSEQDDLMNPFSVSLENTEEKKNTCTLQSWANTSNTCSLLDTGGDNGEFQTHAHSPSHLLLLPSHPQYIQLPPLTRKNDQALNPSEPTSALLEDISNC